MKKAVLFHENCRDGFTAMMALWLKFGSTPDIEYHPVNYNDESSALLASLVDSEELEEVWIVDFMFREPADLDNVTRLCQQEVVVHIYDHHETARPACEALAQRASELQGRLELVYDATRSGAYITWCMVWPGCPVPPVVRYVQDRDLWQWKLVGTKEINSVLQSTPLTETNWQPLFEEWNSIDLLKQGALLLAIRREAIEEHCHRACLVQWSTGETSWLFHYVDKTIASEVCHALLERGNSPGLAIGRHVGWIKSDIVTFSVRSRGEGDAQRFCEARGGGGHPKAAGFSVKAGEDLGYVVISGEAGENATTGS